MKYFLKIVSVEGERLERLVKIEHLTLEIDKGEVLNVYNLPSDWEMEKIIKEDYRKKMDNENGMS